LYYNQWSLVTYYFLREAHVLRELDHNAIDVRLNWIEECRNKRKARWKSGMFESFKDRLRVTPEVRQHLHQFVDLLSGIKLQYKLVITTNSVAIYTNDLAVFDQIEQQPGVEVLNRCRARVDRPQGTMLLKDPQHTHRTYFTYRQLTMDQKNTLEKFLNNQPAIRTSPALQTWFNGRFVRLKDYHFIDHNGSADLVMLSLVIPGHVRKTVPVISSDK
jgi:hypothetical protein